MKLKNLLISAGLALGLAISAGVALNASSKVESVSADAKSWMFAVAINMSEPNGWGGADKISNQQVHVWGDGGVDRWYPLHESGVENVMTTMITLSDSETVNGCQFGFTQAGEGGGWKLSNDQTFVQTKESHWALKYWRTEGMTWTNGKWDPVAQSSGSFQIDYTGGKVSFSEDPANERLIVTLDGVTSSYCFGVDFMGSWDYLWDLTRTSDADLFSSHAAHWFQFKEAGKYDVIIENAYVDGGILTVKKHSLVETYVYYLSEANFGEGNTPNYVYTYGVSEQFGSFPGTLISSVATEVTGRGVLRYGGAYGEYNDQSQYIYKIPVKIGYPGGDTHIMFKSGTDDSQSSEFEIQAGNAYKWSSSNANDGAAIDFLVKAEAKRNAVVASEGVWAYSVCGISKGDAASLWNEYDALIDAVKSKVDSAEVYTYQKTAFDAGDDKLNGLVSYADVMDELARIGQVGIYSSPSPMIERSISDSNTMTIVVLITAVAAVSLIGVLIIIRKRRVQ